jgi:serine/threonine-protein kinase
LLVRNEGGRESVYLADFGLARVYQSSPLSGMTLKGDIGGTVAFMAPEQITNFRDSQPAVDQYSAAASLYQLLTGKLIFDLPKEPRKRLLMVLQNDPIPIQSRRADLPAALGAIIHRALSREPADRFPDVREMRRALLPFASLVPSR